MRVMEAVVPVAPFVLFVLAGSFSPAVVAVAADRDAPAPAPLAVEDIPSQVLTEGFLEAHPDLYYRRTGIRRDKAGDLAAARHEYEFAARFGDKPSQARIGEMYWNGQGVAQDRVQGFLWMALAAERKYREFVLLKAYYWQQLTAAERDRARQQDQAMLAEYGDAAAQRRQALVMRRELHKAAGSMLGHSSASQVSMISYNGSQPVGIDAERFYAETYWKPKLYWQLQDRIWERQFDGTVDVGDLESVPDATAAPQESSETRTPAD